MVPLDTKRFVVLTTSKVEIYKDDHCGGLKAMIVIDNTARIIVLSAPSVLSTAISSNTTSSSNPFTMLTDSSSLSMSSYQSAPSYCFCLQTSTDILELSTDTLELRNQWLGHLVCIVGQKSELGKFVSTVRSESDYRLVKAWESTVVSQSIPLCSGLVLPHSVVKVTPTSPVVHKQSPASGTVGSPIATPTLGNSSVQASNSSSYASFLPFDKWEERFEPEAIRLRLEKERGEQLLR